MPRFAIAAVEQSVLADYMPMSDAFLTDHQNQLEPNNDIPFISEFLVRVVCSTIVDYAKYSPEHLSNPELAEAVIDMVGRWLLKRA